MKKLSIKYDEKVISFNSNPWGLCFRWRYINAEKHCPVTFTRSKSIMEISEKSVKYVQS